MERKLITHSYNPPPNQSPEPYKAPNKITAHNAGWPLQFRFRGPRHQSGVCEFQR